MPTKRAIDYDREAAATERMLDDLDPETTAAEDLTDLRAVTVAVDHRADAERELRDAVIAARANGRSWARIGLAAGITRQAAHERWGNDR
jgi:hypothetical protein